ncbi:adaptin ear-binding coat-associated protein 1-like [Dendronephthya gigantea]|uniref:adaptin ear-binding coat-associated protein 1-like n=1 Tax=Dendronephthya gigantea TaxID=151771 RepID=UPI00106B0CBE|nr:adaptin ear-binding coat-associated protein 1-like [Dendronephthya gigantea]
MADSNDYERILCVKNEVFVFRIPPRTTNRGYRAADWKLDQPDWTGRMRVCSKGSELYVKLEDNSNGELFAKCPVDAHPGIAVESVTDSSRYFVLRIKDDSGRHAFIGMGFQDRGDSFDFNVSLQDHFKRLKQEQEQENVQTDNSPKLDLGFKEGQTIRINFGKKASTTQANKPKVEGSGNFGILPPPPGGGGAIPRLAGPSPGAGSRPVVPPSTDAPSFQPTPPTNVAVSNPPSDWGDFTTARASSQQPTQDGSWVQF